MTDARIIPFPKKGRHWLEDASERAERRLLAMDFDSLGPAGKRMVLAIRIARGVK